MFDWTCVVDFMLLYTYGCWWDVCSWVYASVDVCLMRRL